MSRQSRKSRGYETQRIVADDLRKHVWHLAEPVGAGRPGRDIVAIPDPFSIEIKAEGKYDLPGWMRQAHEAAREGEYAIVIPRLNGQGPATLDAWPVIMRYGEWKRLVCEAGYGDAEMAPCDCEGCR